MGLFDGVRRWAAKAAVRASRNNLALVPKWVRHSFIAPYFWRLVWDYYKGNPTAYACLALLQDMISEPEMHGWQPGERNLPVMVDDHAIRDLMSSPNPGMGEVEFWQYVVTYAAIGGNAYIFKRRSRGKKVVELWPFHDGHVTPIPGRTMAEGMVAYYVLDIGDGTTANPWKIERWDMLPGVAVPASEMIHWKWKVDPHQPWLGMGALVASSGDVETANEMRRYVFSMLKNDATPPFVVTLTEGEDFDEGKAKRLRAQWKQTHGGANRGTPAFLEYGMVPHKLGMNIQELEAGELKDGPDAAICMGFRIQPVVLGALVGLRHSSGVGSDMAAAYKSLATFTLVPIWRALASEMMQGLRDEVGFGGRGEKLAFDLSQVRALQESEKDREERLGMAFDRGGITRAEYREGMGFEAEEVDQVFKESLAIVWVPRDKMRELNPDLMAAEAERRGEEAPENDDEADDGGDEAPGEKGWKDDLARQRMMVDAQRGVRAQLEERLRERVRVFFQGLGITVEGRLQRLSRQKAAGDDLPAANDLIEPGDFDELQGTLEQYAIQVMSETWGLWNIALNSDIAFDLTDPGVARLAAMAGTQVKNIEATTISALRGLLTQAAENGWSIGQIMRGVDDTPGVREFLEQTYQGQDEAVARTELGMAQNRAAAERYKQAGVQHVRVFDNGFENSHEFCRMVDGKVVTLAWMEANLLQHPRCVRAFGAQFDYSGPVWEQELAFGAHL